MQKPKEIISYVCPCSCSPSLLEHLRANTFKSFSMTLKKRYLMQTEFLLVRNQNIIPNIRKVTIKAQELAMFKPSVAKIIYLLLQMLEMCVQTVM